MFLGVSMNKKSKIIIVLNLFFLMSIPVAIDAVEDPLQDSLIPTPKQLWERCKETLGPLTYEIVNDEIVTSNTDPSLSLRRIEIQFISQEIEGVKMGHEAVIFMPSGLLIFFPTFWG